MILVNSSCAESDSYFSTCSPEAVKKLSSASAVSSTQSSNSTVVAYFFCGEPIPYRTVVNSPSITLADFKSLLTRKGNYRYLINLWAAGSDV